MADAILHQSKICKTCGHDKPLDAFERGNGNRGGYTPRGGSNHWTNLQLLHPRCNLRKHARDPIEFMQSEHGLLL